MKTLHFGIIVLQYDFYKSLVCSINDRGIPPKRSVQWLTGKIKLVRSLHLVEVSKPDWCVWIDK